MHSSELRSRPLFERWDGIIELSGSGLVAEYPGVLRRDTFITGGAWEATWSGAGSTAPPGIDDELFEWIDVLEAVLSADRRFCMVELGAGFGRWLVRAAVAARRARPSIEIRLVGVEAEPTHYSWMLAHFRDNGIDPAAHRLVNAAVDALDGEVTFTVGQAEEWYGQAIVDPETQGYELATVRAVSLGRLLADLDVVDIVDLDVQGAELRVLGSAMSKLDDKVKRVHVATHSPQLEDGLLDVFTEHGWTSRWSFGVGKAENTPFGSVEFKDGVQTWTNPRFGGVPSREMLVDLVAPSFS